MPVAERVRAPATGTKPNGELRLADERLGPKLSDVVDNGVYSKPRRRGRTRVSAFDRKSNVFHFVSSVGWYTCEAVHAQGVVTQTDVNCECEHFL